MHFFLLFLCFSGYCYFIGVIKIIHHPLNKLIYSFQKVETGDLSIRINEKEKSEFNYLYQGFNRMADNLDNLINQVYNQKLLLQKAEFKQLQAQINPHFLYNSFFMLHRMIQSEMQEESVKMASELGLYFKYITRNKSEFVSLKDEYAHARIYSNIQALRFEGRIEVSFEELPTDAAFIQVPRLILQPVIENAYNYGLENMVEGGLLKVSFTKGYQQLSIHVEDNGNSLPDDKLDSLRKSLNIPDTSLTTGEISALLNIHQRMQIFFKSQEPLRVERSVLGGLKVILNIEIGEDNSNETTANC
jgi:two-component system sensor histidine kinase YesM